MNVTKWVTVLIWIASAACLFSTANNGLVIAGRVVFWLLLVAHSIEFFIYLPTLRRIGGSLFGHFIQVLLFGIVYWREVKRTQSTF